MNELLPDPSGRLPPDLGTNRPAKRFSNPFGDISGCNGLAGVPPLPRQAVRQAVIVFCSECSGGLSGSLILLLSQYSRGGREPHLFRSNKAHDAASVFPATLWLCDRLARLDPFSNLKHQPRRDRTAFEAYIEILGIT